MPNFNSNIQTNNIDLQAILDTINALPEAGEGLDTSDATATSSDILQGKTAYAQGLKVTGTIPIKSQSDLAVNGPTVVVPTGYYASQSSKTVATTTQASPNITISNNGLITAEVVQSAGYIGGGTKSATKQLTTQAATTITPSKTTQTAVDKNVYTTGAITVDPISADYIITTDATARAADILTGTSAYVNGVKVTGTMPDNGPILESFDGIRNKSVSIPSGYTKGGVVELDDTIDNEVDVQTDLISQIQEVIDSLPEAGTGGGGTEEDITSETLALGANIAQLTSAIADLEQELEGKASGGDSGGSIETCTVEFVGTSLVGIAYGQVSYLTFENGAITPHMVYNLQNLPTTISNCITNSLLVVHNELPQYMFIPEIGCEQFETEIETRPMWYCKLTAANGQTARINIIYNDF